MPASPEAVARAEARAARLQRIGDQLIAALVEAHHAGRWVEYGRHAAPGTAAMVADVAGSLAGTLLVESETLRGWTSWGTCDWRVRLTNAGARHFVTKGGGYDFTNRRKCYARRTQTAVG